MSISTGRLPVKRAGGRAAMPEISRPSKLFQRTICCSAKREVSTPGGAYGRVHACEPPSAGTSVPIWPGPLLLFSENASNGRRG